MPLTPPAGTAIQKHSLSMTNLLQAMVQMKASDLHLKVGRPPLLRIDGSMREMQAFEVLTIASMEHLIASMLDERQKAALETDRDIDFGHHVPGLARFRANVLYAGGEQGLVMRQIPERIGSIQEVGLPKIAHELCTLTRGLVLVTGPTGSGKSTSVAAMINAINESRSDHIITLEDPIEFYHEDKRCTVRQREVGRDTKTFASGLRAAMREDPDVIFVGELRDLETVEAAISAAETGHLVFATLHTRSAPSTIDRIIDMFPAIQQDQIRTMLAESLKAVITQVLLPRASGSGRVPAHEVMICNTGVRNLIREGNVYQIPTVMQGESKSGMQLMYAALANLVREEIVDESVASERVDPSDIDTFRRMIKSGRAAAATETGGGAPTAKPDAAATTSRGEGGFSMRRGRGAQ